MQPSNLKFAQPCRGEIWLVNFNPTKGNEINKARPAVVVSSDAIGKLAIKTVVPFTSWKAHLENNPWMIKFEPNKYNGLSNASMTDALQIRGVATERFVKKLGFLTSDEMSEVTATIAIVIEHS